MFLGATATDLYVNLINIYYYYAYFTIIIIVVVSSNIWHIEDSEILYWGMIWYSDENCHWMVKVTMESLAVH